MHPATDDPALPQPALNLWTVMKDARAGSGTDPEALLPATFVFQSSQDSPSDCTGLYDKSRAAATHGSSGVRDKPDADQSERAPEPKGNSVFGKFFAV